MKVHVLLLPSCVLPCATHLQVESELADEKEAARRVARERMQVELAESSGALADVEREVAHAKVGHASKQLPAHGCLPACLQPMKL